jgi:hypothetical protein
MHVVGIRAETIGVGARGPSPCPQSLIRLSDVEIFPYPPVQWHTAGGLGRTFVSAPTRRRTAGSYTEALLLFAGLGLLVVILGGTWLAAHWGSALAGLPPPPPHPVLLLKALTTRQALWPAQSTLIAAGLGLLLVLTTAAAAVPVLRMRHAGTRVDRAGAHMGHGADLRRLTTAGARATARRLGVEGSPGIPLGRTVPGRQRLWSSWEDMLVLIAGPRTMKTTSYAVPALLEAPGAVIATSNKRDLVDLTRGPRAETGPVWVFDPQAVAGEEPSWWWNPLSYVTDEATAQNLAVHFFTGAREPGARPDAYFDSAGRNLLASYLLAAALDNRPITQVYRWLTRQADDTPAAILAAHGFDLPAEAVHARLREPDRQRAGTFGTALETVSCLTDRTVSRWITPAPGENRPEFHPEEFVRGTGTLYSLSREGAGTAGPLVTALTVAVVEAAEKYATTQPGGRLVRPLLGILDEAANVCRWKHLPDQYSHYGSRGIILMTILQSWSQGVEVWGLEGMRRLFSAANIKVYGGGVSEVQYLDELSRLIGRYTYIGTSRSTGRTGRTTSRQEATDEILSVADLAALPRFRAVLLASGTPPALIKTVPWMNGPHAAKVTAYLSALRQPAARPGPEPAHPWLAAEET